MTSQSKILFTAILILALIATGVIWGLERFSFYTLPSRGGISTTIQVAASPALFEWVQTAASDFNDSNTQITVTVVEVDSKRTDSVLSGTGNELPDAWIPEAGFVALQNGSTAYNREGSSVASDSLLWAKPADREYFLEWNALNEAAVNDRQFNIALPTNNNTTAIASCLSAAQTYHQTTELDFSLANDSGLKDWYRDLEAAIPNATDPLAQLLRRPPAIDVVMITDKDMPSLQGNFETADPLYDILFDYPYIARSSWAELSQDEAAAKQTAVDRFFDVLTSSGNQADLANYGLSPAVASPEYSSRVIQSLGWCWQ
ncbi:MAG: hypothetical protein AAGD96_18900 [Chloroflexota bacterium]